MKSHVNPVDLARVVKLAAQCREDSYDKKRQRYALNCIEAADEACGKLGIDAKFARLIGLALDGWWNDALDWADSIGE